jgi:hypothetical protein
MSGRFPISCNENVIEVEGSEVSGALDDVTV